MGTLHLKAKCLSFTVFVVSSVLQLANVAMGTNYSLLLTSLFKSYTYQFIIDPILEEFLSNDIFHAPDSLTSYSEDEDQTIQGRSRQGKALNIDGQAVSGARRHYDDYFSPKIVYNEGLFRLRLRIYRS